MGLTVALAAFAVLFVIGLFVAPAAPQFFGVILPYTALAVFIFGLLYRIIKWARAPVPYHIPTTTGQQKSLDFIRQSKIDSPFTKLQTFIRMFFEVVTFRSLFRNTKTELRPDGRLTYSSSKWLWLFSLLFHYSFLVIVLRHFRFFTEPTPFWVAPIQTLDGFFQVGVPVIFITTVAIMAGGLYLLGRRLFEPKLRFISLSSDYFPLLLILGIAGTGIWMKHFDKVDLAPVKEMTASLFAFNPVVNAGIDNIFWLHLFLVSALLIYFPMSKLVHMPGIFMSPTRNMANNSRAVRHVNPQNPEVEFHTYEEYEDEFRPLMKAAGIPLEKDEEEDKKDGK